MSYSDGFTAAYRFPAATLSTAAIIGRIYPPAGKSGRLLDVQVVVTTATTGFVNTLDVGSTGVVDAYGTHTTPIASINDGANGITRGVTDAMPEDTMIEVSTNGECTLGAGDVTVWINWY